MSEFCPFEAHLFICTHHRETGSSCAQRGAAHLRATVKELSKQESGWKGRVRVNNAGCLGRCEEGITSVIYPQGRWLTDLNEQSAPELMRALREALDAKQKT